MPVAITESTSIDYDVHGEGPALLLIGGLGFGRWAWFRQIPAFSRHFRTIAFDVRGERELKGGVADLAAESVALLEHLRIKKAHVLGTSLGGFVAQELALVRPDLVDRLVLVGTSYGRGGPESMSAWALADMIGLPSLNAEKAVRRGLEAATSEAYRAQRPEEFEQIVSWRLADSPSLSAYYDQLRAGARFDISRDVGRITSPTLVIHGSDDRFVPAANAVALVEEIPGAKLRVLDDAGHLVFIERYADVNREVVTFLKPRRSRRRGRGHDAPAKGIGEPLRRAVRRLVEGARARAS
ncbi:MAG TPA: alpha/beta fold hydrolase [Rubrobacteraceae bacterium]|nr:alpha/beta fold hydrolase [Rubrobacteraceae bacterium]